MLWSASGFRLAPSRPVWLRRGQYGASRASSFVEQMIPNVFAHRSSDPGIAHPLIGMADRPSTMGRQRTRDDRSLLDRGSESRSGSSDRTAGVWKRAGTESSDSGSLLGPTSEGDGEEAGIEEVKADESETVVRVDRGKLTDRQLEVLETAHELGYYQYPRGSNATEVAEVLDICPSTLAEHLAAAQTKLLADVLPDEES